MQRPPSCSNPPLLAIFELILIRHSIYERVCARRPRVPGSLHRPSPGGVQLRLSGFPYATHRRMHLHTCTHALRNMLLHTETHSQTHAITYIDKHMHTLRTHIFTLTHKHKFCLTKDLARTRVHTNVCTHGHAACGSPFGNLDCL